MAENMIATVPPPPRLHDVKLTGSIIVRRRRLVNSRGHDGVFDAVAEVTGWIWGWNNWLRSFDEGGLESVYRHLNASSTGVYSEVFGLLFFHFKRSIVRRLKGSTDGVVA